MLDLESVDCTPISTPSSTPRVGGTTELPVQTAKGGEDAAKSIIGRLRSVNEKLCQVAQSGVVWFRGTVSTYPSGARVEEAAMERDEFVLLCAGSETIAVPRRTAHTQSFVLQKGASLHWQFLVVNNGGMGFSLRRRTMVSGGAVEEDLIERYNHRQGLAVSGDWTADAQCQVIASFDNTQARFRATTVIFNFSTVLPPPPRPPSLVIDPPPIKILNLTDLHHSPDDDASSPL